MQLVTKREFPIVYGPRLSGISQKIVIVLWSLVTVTSLISLALSIYNLNLWDRIPASESLRYFPEMTPDDLQLLADWQSTVLQTGLSLSEYAFIFTAVRFISGLSLFTVGFLLVRRYSYLLMAIIMAILLSVFAAAGIWNNPLFGWSVSRVAWMNYPVQVLSWLLSCGAIVIYIFPDGKFTPRWMVWLTALLVPLSFLSAFGVDTFLNPVNWSAPFYLLPNILFIGGALFAAIYRYVRTPSLEGKQTLRWYTTGLSLLAGVYFVNLFITDIYYLLVGHPLFEGNAALLKYVLLNEPIWFACETFFAVGLALSVFRNKLLED